MPIRMYWYKWMPIPSTACNRNKYSSWYAPTHLNPTYEYGVTFERGTAVSYGDRKHIFLSGTASIDNKGEIVYPGDILKQTGRMMENISALLEEAGASIGDIMQAIVYLRDPADYENVQKYISTHYPELPHLICIWHR